ncbi:MAG: saccharopine dehydrogenase [Silicimonas sp.]|nr:saccharopine dehydrogenase [Silicimonas sp.]
MAHIWVRAEERPMEQRVALTPEGAAALLNAGHQVTVEESPSRAISIDGYAQAGASIKPASSWVNAPKDVIVLGLKELDPNGPDLRHRHIMFGHAYKGQPDGPALLARFRRGGGTLYDLENLVDQNGRRVAAFGYWAGFAGAAVGLMAFDAQRRGETLGPVETYTGKEALLEELFGALGAAKPRVIIIGAKGRVGSGAADLCRALGLPVTEWDMDETAHGGPFPEILEHEMFVNCILANPGVPVFVPIEAVNANRALRVIADVSCDPGSDYNPVPVYDRSTTFNDPVVRVTAGPPPLDVMAIDNLPSMLPVESSFDFAEQLLPYLLELDSIGGGVWAQAERVFRQYV